MRYQWLKDGKEVSDGDDYKGSTTPEFVIVGTGPQVKGNYKCRVKHKYGEITSSEIYYGKLHFCILCICIHVHWHNIYPSLNYSDPFVPELSSKGISKRIIAKLIGKLMLLCVHL